MANTMTASTTPSTLSQSSPKAPSLRRTEKVGNLRQRVVDHAQRAVFGIEQSQQAEETKHFKQQIYIKVAELPRRLKKLRRIKNNSQLRDLIYRDITAVYPRRRVAEWLGAPDIIRTVLRSHSWSTCPQNLDWYIVKHLESTGVLEMVEYFVPGHGDRVTAVDVSYGTSLLLTASIDHKVKVWTRDPETRAIDLLDSFTAHDADIRDAKFLPPPFSSALATISSDLKCHIWNLDQTQAPNSGRVYRRVFTIPSTPRVPFVSFDFKAIASDDTSIFLALIDRQGLLSLYEPTNPDSISEWSLVDHLHICQPVPPRGSETCFKVRFDQNSVPLAYINSASDDRNSLSLVVTSLNEVKLYRSTDPSSSNSDLSSYQGALDEIGSSPSGKSGRLVLMLSHTLPQHPSLVRDVAWSPLSVRGFDRIATACKDGSIRIFELSIRTGSTTTSSSQSIQPSTRRPTQPQQSSLTTAITGRASQPSTNTTTTTTTSSSSGSRASPGHFLFSTLSNLVMTIPNAHSDAFSLRWSQDGQVLMSSGADGVTKLWRKSTAGGEWLLFADQAVEMQDGSEAGEPEE